MSTTTTEPKKRPVYFRSLEGDNPVVLTQAAEALQAAIDAGWGTHDILAMGLYAVRLALGELGKSDRLGGVETDAKVAFLQADRLIRSGYAGAFGEDVQSYLTRRWRPITVPNELPLRAYDNVHSDQHGVGLLASVSGWLRCSDPIEVEQRDGKVFRLEGVISDEITIGSAVTADVTMRDGQNPILREIAVKPDVPRRVEFDALEVSK
ncbi:MAG: hypothetical protein DHS20C21_01840 [Gemmatimonadota bacterium]|nr:MAG: hypothetical protein DHS20C21_01840 [Gemmatimonadota bacterium]